MTPIMAGGIELRYDPIVGLRRCSCCSRYLSQLTYYGIEKGFFHQASQLVYEVCPVHINSWIVQGFFNRKGKLVIIEVGTGRAVPFKIVPYKGKRESPYLAYRKYVIKFTDKADAHLQMEHDRIANIKS